jgi:hypothetical protein
MVERAHDTWEDHGRQEWERFGLTVTPGRQSVWLDDPDGGPSWDLRSSRAPIAVATAREDERVDILDARAPRSPSL